MNDKQDGVSSAPLHGKPLDYAEDGGRKHLHDDGDAAEDGHLFDNKVFGTSPVPVVHHRFPKTIA
jgi:hypothetical protein